MIIYERLKEAFNYNKDTGIFTWKINIQYHNNIGKEAGFLDKKGYKIISIDYCDYKAHRLAWLYVYGKWPSGIIDHINRIKSDNRIINLRDVTTSINIQNTVVSNSNNDVGLLGVNYEKSTGTYVARITLNRKTYFLGRFLNKHDAHNAYLNAKKIYHIGAIQ